MVDQPVLHGVPGPVTAPQAHPQRGGDQRGRHRGGCMPADDRPGIAIDDERDVDEAGPGAHVGEVRDPALVRHRRGEVPVQQVRCPGGVAVRDRGARARPAHQALDAELAHQPVHPACGHVIALPPQEHGHLAPPVHRLRRGPSVRTHSGGKDRVDDHRVLPIAGAGLGAFPGPVGPLGDLHALLAQDRADRPDRAALGALVLDEAEDQRRRGSSSPTKKTAASFRIALASRSSRFSRSSCLIRSFSLEGTPSRSPAST